MTIAIDERQILRPTDIQAPYANGLNIGNEATARECRDFLTLMDWLIEMVTPDEHGKCKLVMNGIARVCFGLVVKKTGWFKEGLNPETFVLNKYANVPIEIDDSIANNFTSGSANNCTEIYMLKPNAPNLFQAGAKLVGIRAV